MTAKLERCMYLQPHPDPNLHFALAVWLSSQWWSFAERLSAARWSEHLTKVWCTRLHRSALQPDVSALGPVRGPSEGLAQAAALLEALERLLTAPFPAPVPLPAGGLLLMLTRILSMDDVVHSSGASSARDRT